MVVMGLAAHTHTHTHTHTHRFGAVPTDDDEVDAGGEGVSTKFASLLDEFGCGAELGEPAFPGGEPSSSTGPRRESVLAGAFGGNFSDMVAAAAGPAALGGFGGAAVAGIPGEAGVVAPPLDPYEVIRLLEGEVVRQGRYIAELQHTMANRPPLTVQIGTSPENTIVVQIPQH
jgi:hypothetical protein